MRPPPPPPPRRMPNIGCSRQRSPSFQDDDQNNKKKMKISSSSKSSHFFEIIHSSIIQSKCLVLPEKFIRKFGEELSDVAVFMVPSGTIWRVELKKAEGKLSFEGGWQEFVDYYSIRVGHFLLFRYDGNSYFNVVIFDISASEIQYPCHTMGYEESNHETESQAPATLETNSMEIPNVPFPWSTRNEDERDVIVLGNKQNELDQETRHEKFTFGFEDPEVVSIHSDSSQSQSSDECSLYTLRAETDEVTAGLFKKRPSNVKISAHRVNRRSEPDGRDDLSLQERAGASVPTTRSYSTASREADEKRALEAARAFKSENPFCTVIMRPSYVDKKFVVNVPAEFAKVYLNHKIISVTLHISNGRTWNVNCTSGETYTRFIKGWKDFALENHLKQSDVCVFELIDRNNFEMNVSIFRVSGDII